MDKRIRMYNQPPSSHPRRGFRKEGDRELKAEKKRGKEWKSGSKEQRDGEDGKKYGWGSSVSREKLLLVR